MENNTFDFSGVAENDLADLREQISTFTASARTLKKYGVSFGQEKLIAGMTESLKREVILRCMEEVSPDTARTLRSDNVFFDAMTRAFSFYNIPTNSAEKIYLINYCKLTAAMRKEERWPFGMEESFTAFITYAWNLGSFSQFFKDMTDEEANSFAARAFVSFKNDAPYYEGVIMPFVIRYAFYIWKGRWEKDGRKWLGRKSEARDMLAKEGLSKPQETLLAEKLYKSPRSLIPDVPRLTTILLTAYCDKKDGLENWAGPLTKEQRSIVEEMETRQGSLKEGQKPDSFYDREF